MSDQDPMTPIDITAAPSAVDIANAWIEIDCEMDPEVTASRLARGVLNIDAARKVAVAEIARLRALVEEAAKSLDDTSLVCKSYRLAEAAFAYSVEAARIRAAAKGAP